MSAGRCEGSKRTDRRRRGAARPTGEDGRVARTQQCRSAEVVGPQRACCRRRRSARPGRADLKPTAAIARRPPDRSVNIQAPSRHRGAGLWMNRCGLAAPCSSSDAAGPLGPQQGDTRNAQARNGDGCAELIRALVILLSRSLIVNRPARRPKSQATGQRGSCETQYGHDNRRSSGLRDRRFT